MSAIKIKLTQFTGLANVYSRNPYGLAAIVRGLAIDNARLKAEVAGVHDFTDNSTGVAGAGIVGLPTPAAAIDATAAGGAQLTALNASLVKLQNAGLVITNTINEASALLGLPANVSAFGVQVAADTIPALDKVSTAANGAAAASYASAVASFKVAAANLNALIYGANAVLAAVGAPALKTAGPFGTPEAVSAASIPVAVAVAVGPGAIAKADADAFLTAFANNVATLAAAWNAAFNQGATGQGALHVVAA
jgi:hypothetical protein